MSSGVQMIQVSSVKVSPKRLPVKREVVDGLAQSIAKVGLLNPITVTANGTLIAGRNRLEAHVVLGKKEIAAIVFSGGEVEARIAEIDENLFRRHLSALEQGDLFLERKRLYEAQHPAAKPEAIRKANLRNQNQETAPQKPQQNQGPSRAAVPAVREPFTRDAAQRTGIAERTVRQRVQIAESLCPKAKEILRDTPVANRPEDMLPIARLRTEKQQVQEATKVVAAVQKKLSDAEPKCGSIPECQKLCRANCTSYATVPIPPEDADPRYKPLVCCREKHFDETEPAAVRTPFDPWHNLCPDFNGNLHKARWGAEKTAHAPANPAEDKDYINLRDVLTNVGKLTEALTIHTGAELMAAVHRFVPGPIMVYVPSAGAASDRKEKEELTVRLYRINESIKRTAAETGQTRAQVRGILNAVKNRKGKRPR